MINPETQTRIPLLNLGRQTASIRSRIDAAISRVVDHGQFIQGPEVKELEARVAAYCGARYGVACASGTDALLLPLMALGADGKLGKGNALVSQEIDLTVLYAPLHAEFADLNIEGCIVQGDELHLVQRGNKGTAGQSYAGQSSAVISLHWPQVQAWLLDAEDTPPPPSRIAPLELGDIDGIPLTPTDACLLPNGHWLLSAAAENTADSTLDGPCAGSALAVVSAQGKVQQLHYLHGAPKVEGISVQASGSTLTVLMVTDADHPDVPSQLLELVLP